MEYIKETLAQGFSSNHMPHTGPGGIAGPSQDASCLIVAPELPVFLRHPEEELPDLAELWQCETNMYGTRGKGLKMITNPCPSMIAGCSQGWLKDAMPANSASGGFTRRVNFVFSADMKYDNVWPDDDDWLLAPQALQLLNDLGEIHKLRGQYKFDSSAKPLFEKIYRDKVTDFSDEATTYYTATRHTHATKLAMCIAASRKDDLVILREEMEEADDLTNDVKDSLKLVFRSCGSSDMMGAADKILKYIESMGSCTVNQLMGAMWRDCSRPELDVIIVTLRDAGLVKEAQIQNRTVLQCVATASPTNGTGRHASGRAKAQKFGIYT